MDATATDVSNVKTPLGERVNLRMIAVAAVVLLLVGYPVYQFVQSAMNHGIQSVGDAKLVDLKALGNFPFDDTSGSIKDVPPVYRDLDGKKVILEGFMFAGQSAADQVNAFQFVYNIQKCCFGGPPRVQERVFVHVPNGGAVPYYYQQLVRISGTLHVNVKRSDPQGKIDVVYEMETDKVDSL
jgi:hypothetical protein